MKAKKPCGKFVTALISWEPKIHGDAFVGTVLVLYSTGLVWVKTAKQKPEGALELSAGKPQMTLSVLRSDSKGDLAEMAQRFKRMPRFKDYEAVSYNLEQTLKKS